MSFANIFNRRIDWTWQYKVSGNDYDPGGPPFQDGKPHAVLLPLVVLKPDSNHVRLHSCGLKLIAEVKFEKTDNIANIGFSNTIYLSTRRWYYLGDIRAKMLAGKYINERITPLPSWDGDNLADRPWYAVEDEIDDQVTIYFNDAPNLPPYPEDAEDPVYPYGRLTMAPPAVPFGAVFARRELFYISGRDEYVTLLVVQHDDGRQEILDSVAWDVTFDSAVLRGQVTPAAGSGTNFGGVDPRNTLVNTGVGSVQRKVAEGGNWMLPQLPAGVAHAARAARDARHRMIDAGV